MYIFGADPELFLFQSYEDSAPNVIPAYVYFPETGKGNCFSFGDNIGGVHSDNIMLELNPAPADSIVRLVRNTSHLQDLALEYIRNEQFKYKRSSGKDGHGLPFVGRGDALWTEAMSTATINKKYLEFYDGNAKFREFGCDPDWNAYTMSYNSAPDLPDTLRVGGGHLMISKMDDRLANLEICANVVKWMDILVTSAFVHEDLRTDAFLMRQATIIQRRQYYGRYGAFRPKSFPNGYFGVEYRVPGPEWSLPLGDQFYNSLQNAMIKSLEYGLALRPVPDMPELLHKAINLWDREAGLELAEVATNV